MRYLIAIFCALAMTSCQQKFTVQGTVEKTEMGKDKYMLLMKDAKATLYRVLVSRADMGSEYKDVVTGNKVEVTGDTTHWQNEVHLKAEKIKLLD